MKTADEVKKAAEELNALSQKLRKLLGEFKV
jgi:methyl-accepting chemotaxis protein